MKIACYCQHVLGIGHLHRSLEICRALAGRHDVTMIVGGPPVSLSLPNLTVFQLPGLRMDARFTRLTPTQTGRSLDDVKERRRDMLCTFIDRERPDCLLVELYPFGRKAFRFELDPMLEAVRSRPERCLIYCSLRDILVEKETGADTFESRAVATVNRYFDGILVHADQRLVRLEETFGKLGALTVPISYTGYVTPQPDPAVSAALRASCGPDGPLRLLVASIGSGSVGGDLLEAVAAAAELLPQRERWHIRLFTGPYCPDPIERRLRRRESSNFKVERFSDRFVHWLGAADLSVSMAGYNTCLNTVAAGVPALLLPFGQNREQRLRLEKLAGRASLRLLEEEDLHPPRLARLITQTADGKRMRPRLDLNGARRTMEIIEERYNR